MLHKKNDFQKSGQITIIPKPELRGFRGDSLTSDLHTTGGCGDATGDRSVLLTQKLQTISQKNAYFHIFASGAPQDFQFGQRQSLLRRQQPGLFGVSGKIDSTKKMLL